MSPRIRMARKRLGIARERTNRCFKRWRKKRLEALWEKLVKMSGQDDRMQYRWPS